MNKSNLAHINQACKAPLSATGSKTVRICGCAPLQDRKTKMRGPIILPAAPPDRIGLHQRGHWALRGSAPPPLPGSLHLLYYVGKKIVKGDLNTFKGRDFKTEEMLRLTLMLHEFVKVENLA